MKEMNVKNVNKEIEEQKALEDDVLEKVTGGDEYSYSKCRCGKYHYMEFDWNYCVWCGTRLKAENETGVYYGHAYNEYACDCGARVSNFWNFCPNCGWKFKHNELRQKAYW